MRQGPTIMQQKKSSYSYITLFLLLSLCASQRHATAQGDGVAVVVAKPAVTTPAQGDGAVVIKKPAVVNNPRPQSRAAEACLVPMPSQPQFPAAQMNGYYGYPGMMGPGQMAGGAGGFNVNIGMPQQQGGFGIGFGVNGQANMNTNGYSPYGYAQFQAQPTMGGNFNNKPPFPAQQHPPYPAMNTGGQGMYAQGGYYGNAQMNLPSAQYQVNIKAPKIPSGQVAWQYQQHLPNANFPNIEIDDEDTLPEIIQEEVVAPVTKVIVKKEVVASPAAPIKQVVEDVDVIPQSIKNEDALFKAKLKNGFFGVEQNVIAFWIAQDLALRRGYLDSLMYMATSYGFWCTPRPTVPLYTPDPMVYRALSAIEYTNSPIVRAVAKDFVKTLKHSELITELTKMNLKYLAKDAKSTSWKDKSAVETNTGFLLAIDLIGKANTPVAAAAVVSADSKDANPDAAEINVSSMDENKGIYLMNQVQSLLVFNSFITYETTKTAFDRMQGYLDDAISKADVTRAISCIKVMALLLDYQGSNAADKTNSDAYLVKWNASLEKLIAFIKINNKVLAEQLENMEKPFAYWQLDISNISKAAVVPPADQAVPATAEAKKDEAIIVLDVKQFKALSETSQVAMPNNLDTSPFKF